MTNQDIYDVIVIGVGGMGSAALFHLASRGVRVLGLEQYGVAHDRGSSHGLSRIIRLAYHEEPAYVPLLRRAYKLWHDLEERTGEDLLCITGGLDIAPPAEEGSSTFERALASVREHGLEHEVLTGAQVNQRWPGYQLPDDFQALYQPQGGILASERCIRAHCSAALRAGAQLHTGEHVLSWHAGSGATGVEVVTDRAQYRARRLVVTAGAWIADLVPEMQDVCAVQRQVIGWFEVSRPEHFTTRNFPVFVMQDPEGEVWYGFPPYDHSGFKIGKFYHLKEATSASQLDRTVRTDDEQALRSAVARWFPQANGRMSHGAACMFTNTPDKHFIIDVHPSHPQVVLCSACSGHGFKFCSVIGEILADLALQGSTQHDIEFLRIDARRQGHKQLLQLCAGQQSSRL